MRGVQIMSNCYIDVKPKLIMDIAEGILDRNKDSVLVLPAIKEIKTYAPTKKGKCHRLVFEVLIPAEGLKGEGAISELGGFVVVKLPKTRIEDEHLKKAEAAEEVPDEEERHL